MQVLYPRCAGLDVHKDMVMARVRCVSEPLHDETRSFDTTTLALLELGDWLAEHGVTVVFVQLPNTKIELMQPLGADSPIGKFLEKNPGGGMHHLCFEVNDIEDAAAQLIAGGARVIGDGAPKLGAHGLPVLFLHPRDFDGTLIELEEVKPEFEPG